jgi:pimeloyl-ACP methyl ester carboxylesterase
MTLGGFTSPRARAEFDAVYDRAFAALPEPVGQWDILTDFGTARVYRFGQAGNDVAVTPMVLLPGRAGTVVMWEPNLATLVARRPVYALDLIGEPGRSEQTAPIRDGADQAAWLAAVLAALDLSAVHLAGYSFGGWLAANFAVHHPKRLVSLTVIDPVRTFAGFPISLLVRTALTVVPGIRDRARESFLHWVSGDAEIDTDDPVANVIDEGLRTYRIALPTPKVFTDSQLRSIPVPVLALIAGRSVMHDANRAVARARALIPDVRAELWPSATHAIAGESAADVNARVLKFLDEIERSG